MVSIVKDPGGPRTEPYGAELLHPQEVSFGLQNSGQRLFSQGVTLSLMSFPCGEELIKKRKAIILKMPRKFSHSPLGSPPAERLISQSVGHLHLGVPLDAFRGHPKELLNIDLRFILMFFKKI